ncbi:MAG: hypothetical protein A3A24_03930 [Candidatus Buchananbacteria bacterium RIFCSPLOWO2_01_FULL_46_12]|uniref:Bacterial Ig-like domain-containing protein n=2 Tax=Candidatus Buchananiibacteriota TaxID=1817903 RepID=A0A1G1YU15_9BACT|nr:MAG: hypothetical protein A2744_01430 [Candidatus Buchananbacteria bacterium RIFCSPHIGHO2_01_FULL_44_11]OGY55851.1 MAG: hypothetical protein A3A24_03930 [Candidatus Buchananbacteria bacterium RIFCSPLOWO2_01_FULL_46_12]
MASSLKAIKRQHITHRFFLATALTIATVSLVGIVFTLVKATGAATILMSLTISEPPTVSAKPAVSVHGGGSPASLVAYLVNPPSPKAEPEPTVETNLSSLDLSVDLTTSTGDSFNLGTVAIENQTDVPQLRDSRPAFSGNVGIPKAFLFIELHSDPASRVTVSLNADEDGFWSWRPSQPITTGPHTFYLTVFDPDGDTKLGQSGFQFEILSNEVDAASGLVDQTAGLGQPRRTTDIPDSLLDQRQVLFDVRVELLGEGEIKEINPGDQVLAKVTLFNIGAPGQLVDAAVTYSLVNYDTDQVIFHQSETIAVATQTSFLKTFDTRPTLAKGNYYLEVLVAYKDTEASAFEHFLIGGQSVITLPGNNKVDVSFAFQLLMVILTVAIFFTYFEYKQVESLGKKIHQVTEDDLRREGMIS